jgi:hypothetical protein
MIKVTDNANDVGKGATLGAVGGAIIGLISPPDFLASAVVGGGISAGAGAIVDRRQKSSRSAGSTTSSGRSPRPTRPPSTRSTAAAPRMSRRPRPAPTEEPRERRRP